MRIGLGILSKPALLACACFHLSALAQSDDWNVAVLDQILASTPAGSTVARVGDMELLVSGLVAWRNELAGLPAPRSAFSGTAPLWTGGNVYYQFHPSVSAQNQQMFVDAAREWETFANVHFIARTSQPNYILVEEVAGLSGGQATVGMVGGQQAFKIGPNAWSRSVLCHELGHTLGMVHEHQRSDRDSFVTILTNNIASGQEANFVKLPTSQNLGAYDFLSIMHYARNTFSVNPATLNTIEPLPAYSQYLNVLGDGDPILTPSDRAGMATKYGAGPTISATVTNTMDGGPGSLRAALYYAFDHPGTTVTFNIPLSDPNYAGGVFTIRPTDNLPGLSRATTVDGSTQPGNTNPNGPEIVINGAAAQTASVFAHGLHFRGTNCAAHSLVINGFEGDGVWMDGTNTTGNTLSGCFVGINPSGSAAIPNGLRPVNIDNGARGNVIGGTTASTRNVISGGGSQGCLIRDPGTTNNQVLGNYIGL
ncbi:MAG: M12 family metallopeptidase, partial [Verrucomicrobia bacterium]|nr:M12 family metallopeptidase [Verrucomicrobiota bacterium]